MIKPRDIAICCSICGKKLGVVTFFESGISHIMSSAMCCMDCLPKRLDELELKKYNPIIIDTFRKWMKE